MNTFDGSYFVECPPPCFALAARKHLTDRSYVPASHDCGRQRKDATAADVVPGERHVRKALALVPFVFAAFALRLVQPASMYFPPACAIAFAPFGPAAKALLALKAATAKTAARHSPKVLR